MLSGPERLHARLLAAGADPAAALPWLQQARSTYDALWDALTTDERRVSFGDTFTTTGRLLQRAHARLEQPAAALEEAERARSRSFELLLAQQRLRCGGGAAVEAQQQPPAHAAPSSGAPRDTGVCGGGRTSNTDTHTHFPATTCPPKKSDQDVRRF